MATAKSKTITEPKAAKSATVVAKTAKPTVATADTTAETGLPAGFVSPFKRVEMRPGVRIDDGLCCVAMLTNRPLDEIMQAAIKHGLPPHGPAWVYSSMLIAILREYGIKAEEKECPTLAALPDVALITVAYRPETLYGRWAVWHHLRGSEERQAFSYVHDPAGWIEERLKTTMEVQRLITPKSPIFYLECNALATPKGRTAAK